jgi:long-chain acyl-CoA synthetase
MTKKFPAISLAEAHALLTRPGSPFEIEERDIRGVRTRVWKNAPPTMRDVFRLARSHGNKTFVVYGDERLSYDEFARAALAIAEALQRAGVKKGDRVAIAMRNLPEWPAAFFGCLLAGGIAVLLNAWWTGPELQYGLNDSGAKAAIVDRERLERIFEHLQNCPALERVFVSRETEDVAHPQITKLESIIGEVSDWRLLPDRPLPDVPLDPEDDATILYTSGTTGKPKGRSARIAIQRLRCWCVRSGKRARFCAAVSRRRRPIRTRHRNVRSWSCRCFIPPDVTPR